MWESNLHQRIGAIIEIAIGSLLLITLAGGIGVGAGFLWKALAGSGDLRLDIAVVAGGISLLPLIVVVAKVWEVNLSLFGNRAKVERRHSVLDYKEPPGPAIN